jgi:pyridoxine kinase
MRRMAILSIQSRVVAGHVGNSAAVPALHRLGHDVWAVDTVTFSNHPAHGAHTGRVRSATEQRDLLRGLSAGGRFKDCDALLSGYLGAAATGPVVLDTLARLRAARPDAVYLCDPVMGDDGDVYVDPPIVDFFRSRAVPAADILTPNAFEAGLLTGQPVRSAGEARAAANALRIRGARAVVVTGVKAGKNISAVGVDDEGAWQVTTPCLERPAYGAGDLFAALLLAHHLAGRPLADCMARAVSSVHAVLTRAAGDNSPDLPLIAALDLMASPGIIFAADRLR